MGHNSPSERTRDKPGSDTTCHGRTLFVSQRNVFFARAASQVSSNLRPAFAHLRVYRLSVACLRH
ncbi:UNVERIFIED_CONTAM: hypothetical protein Sradi_6996100 [Sesamum radiatum]|uniref:Uncharacterized protein n=1 Tax=Sesamum radiatum TaxID=300843 RepID=A0AAW2JEC9_SESRA